MQQTTNGRGDTFSQIDILWSSTQRRKRRYRRKLQQNDKTNVLTTKERFWLNNIGKQPTSTPFLAIAGAHLKPGAYF